MNFYLYFLCTVSTGSLIISTTGSSIFNEVDFKYKKLLERTLEFERLQSQKRCGLENSNRGYIDRSLTFSIKEALNEDHGSTQYLVRNRRNSDKIPQPVKKLAYFSGQIGIFRHSLDPSLLTPTKHYAIDHDSVLPSEDFSLELWLKPEGGQTDPAVIIELKDVCYPNEKKGWSIGIRAKQELQKRESKFFFNLETAQNKNPTTIYSHDIYRPNEWIHIFTTYNGKVMKFYVNGAQVSSSTSQFGEVFTSIAKSHCKELRIGGSKYKENMFRGSIEVANLWNFEIVHDDIMKMMTNDLTVDNGLIFSEQMANLRTRWDWDFSDTPHIEDSDRIVRNSIIGLKAPTCGRTICDTPTVINNYVNEWEFRKKKSLRYRVVKLAETSGANPLITDEEIRKQNDIINDAYSAYNISWELRIERINNTSLRNKYLMLSCLVKNIELGQCVPQCIVGGVCFHNKSCDIEKDLGNGVCNSECNDILYDWDRGDCCNPNVTNILETCFDPYSPLRPYLNMIEFKELFNLDNENELTVYVVNMENDIHGLASYPWDNQLFSILGGVTMSPSTFKLSKYRSTLIHELGHILGLWHVHHGVSEMDCSHQCYEHEPSMETGDLCLDTNPTPTNYHCTDPSPSLVCGRKIFTGTPYNNYMGYADDPCPNSFTPQQAARMHCYIDLKLRKWFKYPSESMNIHSHPPPLSPKIVSSSENEVLIAWIPPFNYKDSFPHLNFTCSQCKTNGRLVQYASKNYSPLTQWPHYQALGPPDAPTCQLSLKTWQTEYDNCFINECSLTLGFTHDVVPTAIKLWVSSHVIDGIELLQLQFKDGSFENIKNVLTSCEVPYTTKIKTNKILSKVKIYVKSIKVSIDALEVTSSEWYEKCRDCKLPQFRVFREPSFKNDKEFEVTNGLAYLDKNVEKGIYYKYKIQALYNEDSNSEFSPILNYKHLQGFCGDGKLDELEECDDGNASDGDGCNTHCKTEKYFKCRGSPSMCYMYYADGICEDFEKLTDGIDCGFHTPDGFLDQWAISTEASDDTFEQSLIPGPPNLKTCMNFDEMLAMENMLANAKQDNNRRCNKLLSYCSWLTVSFSNPVVATSVHLYLRSDGLNQFLYTSLIDTNGVEHPLTEEYQGVMLSCRNNPIVLHAVQNLSKPFFHTKSVKFYFTSGGTDISGVKLRSLQALNPVTINTCRSTQLYSKELDKCVQYNCKKPICARYVTKNAKVSCSGYEEGDTCSIVCDEGYNNMADIDFVRCINGDWNHPGLICKPIDCGIPFIPHADVGCTEGTIFRKTCMFKCRLPARQYDINNPLMRSTDIGKVTCEKTGEWSLPNTFCHLTCGNPPALSNANLVSRRCKQIMKSRGKYDYGMKCKYRCKVGFTLKTKQNYRQFKLRCEKGGDWHGPRCVPVTCPKPSMVYSGLYNCTNSFNFGSVCRLNCPDSTRANMKVMRCNAHGKWEGSHFQCNFENVRCPSLAAHSDLIHECDGNSVGSKCLISCKQFTKIPINVKTKLLLEILVCTGARKWSNNLKDIHCQNICGQGFSSDYPMCSSQFLTMDSSSVLHKFFTMMKHHRQRPKT